MSEDQMEPSANPKYLVIARALDEDPVDGATAQLRMAVGNKPTGENLTNLQDTLVQMFEESFGNPPARIGVAVLPYAKDLDDPDEAEE